MVKKTGRKEKRNDAEVIFDGFSQNMRGLSAFVGNVAPIVIKYDKRAVKRMEKVAKRIDKIISKGKDTSAENKREETTVKLSKEQFDEVIRAASELPRISLGQAELLYKSSFVMLISYFDFLISDLIHCYYRMYPESLSGKDLGIPLNELKLCDDISEAIDIIVNKKADAVSYGNLESQKEFLERDLKIDTKENIVNWAMINEGVERRNIIVHNNSRINRRYLGNVDLSLVPERRKEMKEGEEIVISEKYFARLYEEILITGIILVQCCWRKWRKDDIDNADNRLISAIYNALVEERWSVTERLGFFSKECEVYSTANRLYLDINYCQSLKWQDKKNELEKELKKFDVSSLSPKYLLALAALKSNREGFYRNFEKAITVDEMKEIDFMEWPLFREIRKDADYEEKIKSAFARSKEVDADYRYELET